MTAPIRQKFNHIDRSTDPIIVCGPDGEITVISKSIESVGFAQSAPPFDRIELFCQKLTHKPVPLVFKSVIMPIISEVMVRRGNLMMHAGCAATQRGEGILLLADSGGGKTTTVFSMVQAGFKFISDDLVIAAPGEKGLDFIPVYEKINITQQTADFFPELRNVKKAFRKEKTLKVPVDPNKIFGTDQMADHARAAVVIVLEVARNGPRLEELQGSEMLHYLLKSNTFARRASLDQSSIDTIWDLLQQCRLFKLITGYKPNSIGRWLAHTVTVDVAAPKWRLGLRGKF